MALPALPSDMVVLVDASRPSSSGLNGVRAGSMSLIDRSGPAVQATAAVQPTIDLYNAGAGPSLITGGGGAPLFAQPSYLDLPAFANAIPGSLFVVSRCDGAAVLAELSANIATTPGVLLTCTTGPTVTVRGPGGAQSADAVAGANWNTDNTLRALVCTYDGTAGGIVLSANGVPVPLSFGAGTPGTGSFTSTGRLFADHAAANALTGGPCFVGIVPGRVVTAGEVASFLAYVAQFWHVGATGAVTGNSVGVGDSLMNGFDTQTVGDAPQYGFYQRALNIVGPTFGAPHNFAVSGAQLITGAFSVQNQWATLGGRAALAGGLLNDVVLEGGINNVSAGSPTTVQAATTLGLATGAEMATVAQLIASNMLSDVGGGRLHVCTIPLPLAGGFQQRARKIANAFIRANYRSWGNAGVRMKLIDVGANPALSSQIRGNYQPFPYYVVGDNTHPRKAGQELWGALAALSLLSA